jgi:hypothetical protein
MLRRKREQQEQQKHEGSGQPPRRVPQHEHHSVDVQLSSPSSSTCRVLSITVREVVKHLQFARGQVHAPCDQLEAWLGTLPQPQLRSAAARRAAKVRGVS